MRKYDGFTLIELVLVIVIISILAAMSSKPLMQGLNLYTTGQNINTADWQGNYALEHMSRMIRSLTSSSSITAATATQFTFKDDSNTSIAYNLSSGSLVENSNILAPNASALAFTYYDRTGTATATINAIRFVKIALTISKNNYTYTYTTSVFLPNLP